MRIIALSLVTLSLSACVAVEKHVLEPSVAARYNSQKTAEAFAHCASAALPEFELSQNGTAWALVRQRGIVLDARWDFFRMGEGSQAELRSGRANVGEPEVRACA